MTPSQPERELSASLQVQEVECSEFCGDNVACRELVAEKRHHVHEAV